MKVTELKEIISKELNKLNRSIVATPDSRENLDAFSKANQGSSDMILTQMAIQFGYKLAMDSIVDIIEQQRNRSQVLLFVYYSIIKR